MLRKNWLHIMIGGVLVMAMLLLGGCGSSEESQEVVEESTATEATVEESTTAEVVAEDGSAYGYTGDDPAIAAVYKYLAEDMSSGYEAEEGEICVPVVLVIAEEEGENGETDVYGDFWIEHYKLEGDTLMDTAGGNYPGVIHVAKAGESYEVTGFDQVADGGDFDSSAREIFGDHYDAFMEVYTDDDAVKEARGQILSDYVKANGLDATQYQDYGWDPVKLP